MEPGAAAAACSTRGVGAGESSSSKRASICRGWVRGRWVCFGSRDGRPHGLVPSHARRRGLHLQAGRGEQPCRRTVKNTTTSNLCFFHQWRGVHIAHSWPACGSTSGKPPVAALHQCAPRAALACSKAHSRAPGGGIGDLASGDSGSAACRLLPSRGCAAASGSLGAGCTSAASGCVADAASLGGTGCCPCTGEAAEPAAAGVATGAAAGGVAGWAAGWRG